MGTRRGSLGAIEIECVDRISEHVRVIVCTSSLHGIDRQEAPQRRHIRPSPHLDGGEALGVLDRPLVLTEPSVGTRSRARHPRAGSDGALQPERTPLSADVEGLLGPLGRHPRWIFRADGFVAHGDPMAIDAQSSGWGDRGAVSDSVTRGLHTQSQFAPGAHYWGELGLSGAMTLPVTGSRRKNQRNVRRARDAGHPTHGGFPPYSGHPRSEGVSGTGTRRKAGNESQKIKMVG